MKPSALPSKAASFWKPFLLMAVVLMIVYAIRPDLANGILWLFIILAAAEVFTQGV